MEQLSVGSGSDFINDSWFQIQEDSSWHVFSGSCFREEGVEGIITTSDGFIRWHLTIWLDTMLQAEELPAGVTDLDTALTNMNTNDFSHFLGEEKTIEKV
jgi:hypothetical protein